MINQSSKFQRFWILSIIITSPLYLRSGQEGVDVFDIVFAGYYFGSLYFWLFWAALVKKIKLVKNTADFFLLLFFVLAFGFVFISKLNSVTLVDAFREYIIISMVLIFFPLRELFNTKKQLIQLGIIFSISVLLNDLGQFYDYYKGMTSGVQYAYQVLSGTKIRINQTLFTFSISVGTLFFLYPQKIKSKIWLILVVGTTSAALVTTFSRTFWVLVLGIMFIFIIIIPLRQKIQLAVVAVFVSVSIVFMINIFFKQQADVVFTVLEKRLTSSTQGKADMSLKSRLSEYKVLINKIKENPLQGNGFFKEFSFYNPIYSETSHTITVHNGYLYLAYRIGIPMFLMYLYVLFYYFGKSIKTWYLNDDLFYKFIAISGFTGLLVLILSSLTSSQFFLRDGTMITAYSLLLIEFAYQNRTKEHFTKLDSIDSKQIN